MVAYRSLLPDDATLPEAERRTDALSARAGEPPRAQDAAHEHGPPEDRRIRPREHVYEEPRPCDGHCPPEVYVG